MMEHLNARELQAVAIAEADVLLRHRTYDVSKLDTALAVAAYRLRQATDEVVRLSDALAAERNKPASDVAPQGNEVDCRNCAHFYCGDTIQCALARMPPIVCINGDAYLPTALVRLYDTARKGEGGK